MIAAPGFSLLAEGNRNSRAGSAHPHAGSVLLSVVSDLSDYEITADHGSRNPWRPGRVGRHVAFTVRLRPTVTAAQQHSENAIPMIDQNPPASPSGPRGVGYVIFRTYVPAGGDTKVQLPAITVTRRSLSQGLLAPVAFSRVKKR